MGDAELKAWWPDLGTVVEALRRGGRDDVADALSDALRVGGTSSEILGEVGLVLRRHRALRRGLDEAGKRAWDGALKDVRRAFPGARLPGWLARLLRQ